jgi:hypothetical protein
MAGKRKTVEARMYEFKQATESLVGDELLSAIKSGLNTSESLIVEMAAKAVVELEPGDCRDELVAAYRRFVVKPGGSPDIDKNCRAKLPLVEALNRQGFDDADFYLAGMKYIQLEPVYGGSEDTAVHVRGVCAYGLIDVPLASQTEMLFALVDLLNDKEHPAREHAARALGSTGLMAAAPVLRMKVLTGDSHIEVVGACLSGLMQYRDSHSLEFVAGYLSNDNPALAIEAGLALAESRNEEAVRRLIDAADELYPDIREPLLVSVGLSRLPMAVDYLIGLIEKNGHDAVTAVQALAPVRFDAGTKDRVQAAVEASGKRDLARAFREHFSS